MANDQFHLPGQHGPLQEALNAADSFQYAQERKPELYKNLEAAAERIHGYRRTALEIESTREPGLIESAFGIKRPKVTLDRLINQETYIGGEAWGEGNRFWLSHKGSSSFSPHSRVDDWYHVRDIYDPATGRKISETVLHFEVHPTHVNKLSEGRPVPLMVEELETLIRAIELYEQRVRERLYPFDQELFDLLEENDNDTLVVPNALEERFGKEIVERVLEAYKAQRRARSRDDYDLTA